ncbi:MAG: ATP-dependent zinc metalloprotease FtsH [Hyphomonas oceanitis]|uniref:ATP-dependent zinc metalloprotease FtsH n=1 Tax=Hyphomonas oceanitis SCH89 TaxID=1280953 RepID=A0A059G868_9PROT|nr:ATP-dependent zinc metalloprotease FtsH [Hyphomonas oceanitis]KDA02780.1 ATP-dependent metalloprotease FtsH [Hyphomonas oceanitis SCH89]
MSVRNLAIWGAIALLVIGMAVAMGGSSEADHADKAKLSEIYKLIDSGQITEATLGDQQIVVKTTDNRTLVSELRGLDMETQGVLVKEGVPFSVDADSGRNGVASLIFSILPILLIVGFVFFMMRQMQGGGGRGAMSFGKSRARLLTEKHGRVTFDDVAGVDEAKEELQEIVEFLQDPSKFQRLGGKIPKGALLVGPPGTGKTLLARAVAGEAGVPFFTISGSDFVEMFVGVGASRVRDMFEQAKRSAPCIIFIDEIDAVGRSRGAGLGGGNDEREQTLNQLLVEMDGFEANEGIILVAATNRPDVLDPALLRPGRFDRQITVGNPDIIGREKILRVHMRNVPLAKDVDSKTIARGTPGFSGADLANLVNEAALLAARRGKRVVAMAEFEDAKDKVLMGPERRSMVMSEKEKELTAWHEAGHAIVAMKVPSADPVHKATIIPRGRALGMVMQLPEDDKLSMSKIEMTSRLAIMMGGRVAEELKFGHDNVTAGAASDIQQATRLARAMVTRWGFADNIGPVDYGSDQGDVFLGQQLMQSSHVSEDTSRKIEEEVRKLIQTGMDEARRIMTDTRRDWEIIAEGLLEYETLSGFEMAELLKGNKPTRPDLTDDDSGPASAVPITGKRRKPKGDAGLGDTEPNPA